MRKILLFIAVLIIEDRLIAQEKDTLTKKFNDTATLKTYTLEARKSPIQLLPDKIVINVEASVANTGTTVLEILEKSPGITFDRNGGLSLKGRQGVVIMIDDKPVQISGTDLNNLLSAMTSSQVETIEIIDNPSAKYDAAGNAGIINIKTKKNRQKGFNGNVSLAFGQGRYPRSINTITLNKYSGRINLFATLGANELKNFSKVYALRKYYTEGNQSVISMLEQPSYFSGSVTTQTLKTGLDYFISKKTTIGMVATGTLFKRNTMGNNIAQWMDGQGKTDSTILTETNQKEILRNGNLNINGKHVFNSNQELTIDFDALVYRINNNQIFSNQFDAVGGYTEYIQGFIPSRINVLTAKADYSHRFKKGLKLDAGGKLSHVKTDNKGEYFYRDTGRWEPDYGKTNHFLYEENIQALYTNAERRIGKWTLQAGLRYENTSYIATQLGNPNRKDSSFSRNYHGLFPSATVSVQTDSLNSFTIIAGRRIDRPPFQILNPFVFVINKYTYQSGNPFYRPQYTWKTELTHSFNNKLTTSISYSITNDYFSQVFTVDKTGIITYTEGNLDKMENYGLSVSTQYSPAAWWSISAQININHKRIKGYVWENLEAFLTQMNLNINNQFNLKKGWSAELSGFMQTRERELQEITDPTGQIIMGVSKQLFKKKATLRFSVRDIFYTQAMKGNTVFKQATEYFKIQRDSRAASIAFTYRFGKSGKLTSSRNTGGADDEMKRANTPG